MLLQPIVENAITHGLSGKKGRVEIWAETSDQTLIVWVKDDGKGMDEEELARTHAFGKYCFQNFICVLNGELPVFKKALPGAELIGFTKPSEAVATVLHKVTRYADCVQQSLCPMFITQAFVKNSGCKL